MYEKPLQTLLRILKNRLFVFIGISGMGFLLLVNTLFHLQLVQGETYEANLNEYIAREIIIPAPRGNIYDRYGRPLATNQTAFSVNIDPSIPLTQQELNLVLLNLIKLLEENGEEFIDTLPITLEEPYEYTFQGANAERHLERWKLDLNLNPDDNLSATEALDKLKVFFGVNDMEVEVSNHEARMIVSLRANLYTQRFLRFNPVNIAKDVSMDTVTVIEEEIERFKSIFIDTEPLRHYPGGKYFSHTIGYIGTIPETADREDLAERGYRMTDLIGITGLELSFENELRGDDGKENVIVNNIGRRVGVIEGSRVEPVQGDDVYLTLDKQLQMEVYDILENMLAQTIINMLNSSNPRERLTVQELLSSLTRANNISARDIFESEEGTASFRVKEYVLTVNEEATPLTIAGRNEINNIIADGISNNSVKSADILLVMHEQELITGDENFVRQLQTGAISPLKVVVEKLQEGEITPHMTNLDPSTGSVVVVDVNNGEVLASVSYPSYDNNNLVNNLRSEYYTKLLEDPSNPLINRPFMELRPPGSTFKMISGIAAMESGVISPTTTIYDGTFFTRAGQPAPRCWSNHSHGHINVSEAIAHSCNYFFFEAIYRLGNAPQGNSRESIDILNKYMIAFGLNDPTGVEIGEAYHSTTYLPTNISSPELQAFQYEVQGLTRSWADGDTIRTAIGQSANNYTAATMARYTAGLATKGEMYDLRLLKSISSQDAIYHTESVPFDMGLEISDSSWKATHDGMLLTTETGTARNIFRGFPMRVGAKTGTAQQIDNRREHTSFNGFAPFDDPQIAVYVVIPFSNTATTASPATQVGRDVIAAYFNLDKEPERPLSTNDLLM